MSILANTTSVRVHIEKTFEPPTSSNYVAHVDLLDADGNVLLHKELDWIANASSGYKDAVEWASDALAADGLEASWVDEYDESNMEDPQEFSVSRR